MLDEGGGDRPPLAVRKDADEKGAIIVWRAIDNAGTPPAEIKAQFPTIVPEVPRAFERMRSMAARRCCASAGA